MTLAELVFKKLLKPLVREDAAWSAVQHQTSGCPIAPAALPPPEVVRLWGPGSRQAHCLEQAGKAFLCVVSCPVCDCGGEGAE